MRKELAPFFTQGMRHDLNEDGQSFLEESARTLLQLKLELLLADNEYEFDFIDAGASFDPERMDAVCERGDARNGTTGMRVRFCIFPAMLQYDKDDPTLDDKSGHLSVLVCNKTFYPRTDTIRRNVVVVAKATVLLD